MLSNMFCFILGHNSSENFSRQPWCLPLKESTYIQLIFLWSIFIYAGTEHTTEELPHIITIIKSVQH